MARYVVLEFDDDRTAEAFVRKVDDKELSVRDSRVRAVGVFQRPSRFCECPQDSSQRSKRSKKNKWWCCPDCGRARPNHQVYTNNLYYPKSEQDDGENYNMTLTVKEGPDRRPGEPRW